MTNSALQTETRTVLGVDLDGSIRIYDWEPIFEETPKVKDPINYELLERVASYIEKHPDQLDMHYWDLRGCGDPVVMVKSWLRFLTGRPPGGCVAHFADRLSEAKKKRWEEPSARAKVALGINEIQAQNLFTLPGWPKDYRPKYIWAKSHRIRATVTAARIRHFITTQGAE